ncbi:MAG: hypothetical protein ACHP7N_07390 [Caulobacterales bacterium]
MIARLCLALAAWACLAGGACADSPGFLLFQKLCIDTHAKPDVALAAARAAGFVRPMGSMTKDLPSLQFEGPQALAKLVDDGAVMLIVGAKPFPAAPGTTMIGCALVVAPPETGAEEALEAWAGAGRITAEDGQPFFLFVGDRTHRRAGADLTADELAASAKSGDLQIAASSHKPEATVLIYGLVQP